MAANKPKPAKHRSLSEGTFQQIIGQQLKNADDRTAAIVGAGFLEHELARAIMARLRPFSPSEHNRLFDSYGVLSSFAQKIDMGYALRIYDKAERKELEAIKAIRNQFAHNLHTRTFSHPKVRKECRALLAHKYGRWLTLITRGSRQRTSETLRQQFHNSVVTMYVMLISGIKNVKRPAIVSELSLDTPMFRTWLETGALPKLQVSPNLRVTPKRGGKKILHRPRSSQR